MNNKKIVSLLLAMMMAIPTFSVNVKASEATSEEIELISSEDTDEVSEDEETEPVDDNRIIPDGITIEGIDVSGMTVTEAESVVDEFLSVYDDVNFTLSANGQTIDATGQDLCICAKNSDVTVKAATYGSYGNFVERFKASEDLSEGRTKNFSISVAADTAGIIEYLDSVADEVNIEAVDNGLTRVDGEFQYVEGSSGVVVMVAKSAAEIEQFIAYEWDGNDASFELETEVEEPRGTEEELSQITDLLGSFSTDFSSSSAARKNNVANGASFINGTILYPGDEFSVLETIRPFSAENGYQLAGSYENGTTVETYGGGICQVSTTLYGAVREAEVEVVTRSAHSMVVAYVLPSMDAAISDSSGKDFQIRNNKNYPIYIEGYCENSHIYFNIYGKEEREETHSVSYESEITSVTVQDTTWVADPAVPLGVMTTVTSGHTGYTARLWKIITEDGEEVSRNVYNNSKYSPSNRTVTVGTASANAAASEAMAAAVATQDAATIANAIAVYAPGVTNTVPFVITPQYSVTVTEDTENEEATEGATDGITEDTTGETTETTVDETTGEVIAN